MNGEILLSIIIIFLYFYNNIYFKSLISNVYKDASSVDHLVHVPYFNYKLNGETCWYGTCPHILSTNWMVKHLDLVHVCYFNYKLNGEHFDLVHIS